MVFKGYLHRHEMRKNNACMYKMTTKSHELINKFFIDTFQFDRDIKMFRLILDITVFAGLVICSAAMDFLSLCFYCSIYVLKFLFEFVVEVKEETFEKDIVKAKKRKFLVTNVEVFNKDS